MRTRTTIAILSIAAGFAALLPSAAMAEPGYMTCQAANSEKQRVFTTPKEFAANSGDADKAFNVYIAKLQAEKVPMIGDLAHVQGICHWEGQKGVAMKMTTNYLIHYIQLGYFAFSDVSMADPFIP